jgi:DNA-binding XRE family transcriptional regulator
MKTVEFNLCSWREPLGMSKLRAARTLGIDKNVYLKYEKEGKCPQIVKLGALAVSMGVRHQ